MENNAKIEVEADITPMGEVIKIDDVGIGEFKPDADQEAVKNKKKLQEIEEYIKEVKLLSQKTASQRIEFEKLELEIDKFLDSEKILGNLHEDAS